MRDEPDLPDALDPQTLSWLAAAFGWPAAATGTLVQRGAMGATYRIETPTGPVAAKRLFDWHPLTEELVDWMARFADRCRDAGVPSPRALPGRDGRLLQAADNGARWRCLDWIDGAVPDRLDPQAACWLAEQAAVIHRMAEPVGPGAELHPWYRRSDLDWPRMAERAAAARHGGARPAISADVSAQLTLRAEELAALGRWAGSVGTGDLIVTHNDLKVQNTLVAGNHRWLLDWEQAGPGVSWREVGLIGIHFVRDHRALQAICGAYREAGGPGWPHGRSLFATGVCVWLNFLWLQLEVLLDPAAGHSDRSFAAPIVSGLLADIPGFAELDAAAVAVRPR
ncbi:phosphotransferase enzyme family protein [Nakamurella aerolata]|uniref:Aminoglycoside phosphotransferase domain-containing protein n=1 Tax=Nakamurella aerolata TaxID=1656892 RepID=A0A849A6Y9_9ACTN|nr:hypothetical protein [Nakamurella aerolata]NNG34270.1 hypothetical protein [Nakamurella aerolata]